MIPLPKKLAAEFVGTLWLVLGGCGSAVLAAAFLVSLTPAAPTPQAQSDGDTAIWFREVGVQAGVDFVHAADRTDRHRFPEIMGGGVAMLDYDGDGDLDLYLVQGGVLGKEAEALPYYEKAVALGLSENELAGALIGLGSTLRSLGHYDRAIKVLRSALAQFPDNRELEVFLAMALHGAGQNTEAMKLLLTTIADTTEDPGLTTYQRAIRFHASKL